MSAISKALHPYFLVYRDRVPRLFNWCVGRAISFTQLLVVCRGGVPFDHTGDVAAETICHTAANHRWGNDWAVARIGLV